MPSRVRRSPDRTRVDHALHPICPGRDLAYKLNQAMEHIMAWRIAMLAKNTRRSAAGTPCYRSPDTVRNASGSDDLTWTSYDRRCESARGRHGLQHGVGPGRKLGLQRCGGRWHTIDGWCVRLTTRRAALRVVGLVAPNSQLLADRVVVDVEHRGRDRPSLRNNLFSRAAVYLTPQLLRGF